MKTKIIQNIKVIVLALVLALGVGYAYADFSLPLNLPPTCISGNPGCDAPLNVGSTPQIKSGWLEISAATTTHSLRVNTSLYDPAATGLYVWGTSTFYGNVTIVPGASSGKVLTSDASGNASWQAGGGSIPTGAVMAFNLSTCPSGWIPADGNNSTVDLRGYFVRGLGTNSDGTVSGALGVKVADAFKSHTHSYVDATTNGSTQSGDYVWGSGKSSFRANSGPTYNGGTTGATGDTETRPKNIALLYCQKN